MKSKRLLKHLILFLFVFSVVRVKADIVLIGDNAPFGNINDGNFSKQWVSWRKGIVPEFWKAKIDASDGTADKQIGYYYGRLYCGCNKGILDSKLLKTNYKNPQIGDKLFWSFDADLEYICSESSLSMGLVFGKKEDLVAKNVKIIGSDRGEFEHFSGQYTITKEDLESSIKAGNGGYPFIRLHFTSKKGVKIFVDNMNVKVEDPTSKSFVLSSELSNGRVKLDWTNINETNQDYKIYRCQNMSSRGDVYKLIGEVNNKIKKYNDNSLIFGEKANYIVTQGNKRSNIISIIIKDKIAPKVPQNIKITKYNTEIKISWNKNKENDIAGYNVYRNGTIINNSGLIKPNFFVDLFPPKDKNNFYMVKAIDYSGNQSEGSNIMKTRVKARFGAAFSDLIEPIPVIGKMRNDVWGAKNILPRDITNGIEDPRWSYWGGRPVYDNGKYNLIVARWPEGGLKGHWMWPFSKITYAVSDSLLGPYKVARTKAYEYKDSFGHNPDIILMNDGTFALYALIDWKATFFTSKSMAGPWKLKGEIKVREDGKFCDTEKNHRYFRNLSGVQCKDNSILIVTKAGAMMKSTSGLLGPYDVLTQNISFNKTIPLRYRKTNYEDPVLWKDDVQFHMMINANHNYRAIYLRSPDGIHWKYNPGIAFNPNLIYFSDGTQNKWDKVERPHVVTDKYGRAVALSLACLDVPKEYDYGNDNHTSKNVIIPLTVARRLKLLTSKVTSETKKVKVLIMSEKGFDACKDIDLSSLRFGSTETVNFGEGCRVLHSKKSKEGLIVEFGDGNGFSALNSTDFTLKLLGNKKDGKLIFGYTKLTMK